MALLPTPQHSTTQLLDDTSERLNNERFRFSNRLGASQIGHECERKLWMAFRWGARERIDGQKARIFSRGHLEETRVIELMRDAGLKVWDYAPDGQQYTYTGVKGHLVVKLDGVVQGLPESKQPHLLEIKGLNQKGFDWLKKNGLQNGKSEHYDQMQIGMGLINPKVDRGLYVCICKNTEEIYCERIKFDFTHFTRLQEKARRVIEATRAPEKVEPKKSGWPCKWCVFNDSCHGDKLPEQVNCRTCMHSTPVRDGTWSCEKFAKILSVEDQKKGCLEHLYHPDFVPLEVIEAEQTRVTYKQKDGTEFYNHRGGDFDDIPF